MELRTSSDLEAELFLNSKYHLIDPEPYSNFDGFTKPETIQGGNRLLNELFNLRNNELNPLLKKRYLITEIIVSNYTYGFLSDGMSNRIDFLKSFFNKMRICPYKWGNDDYYDLKYIEPTINDLIEGKDIIDALIHFPYKAFEFFGV